MEINLTNNGGGRSRGGSSSSQASSFGGSRGGNGGGFNGRRNRTQRGTFLNFNKQQARSPKDPFAKYVKRAEAIKDAVAYVPVNKFSDFNVSPKLRRAIEVRGFIDPTPIQDQSIPYIIEGRDLIGIAQTGTGKTAAFLIPLIDKVLQARRDGQHSSSLIITPTRELAFQIEEELVKFHDYQMNIFSVCCVGGVRPLKQIQKLSRPLQFVIGTPGRLIDLEKQGFINFKDYQNIVLDEVDRMLDMGFRDDMNYIISRLPDQKQCLFFSATMDSSVEPIANSLLVNPVTVEIKKSESNKNIDQDIVKIFPHHNKTDKLTEIMQTEGVDKVLIFSNTKIGTESIARQLHSNGFIAEALHGDKNMRERQIALRRFKNNEVKVLVATDVAARGLDIPNVSHVINYDEPMNYDDYIHRIGRTGRGGNTGIALTFVNV